MFNSEAPSTVIAGGESPVEIGGEVKPVHGIRESLTRKAARFYDDAEYSDQEYRTMLEKYDETMKSIEQGNIVSGTVLLVTDTAVIVDIGFKSEGSIPIQEFGDVSVIHVGDRIEVFLEDVENQDGQLVLSKQKADFMKVWDKIKEIYDNNLPVEGKLVRRIKGGIVVDLLGVDAFLPGSQIDIRQVKNFDQFIGEAFKLKIIKINKTRRNIVVSRRVVLEEERAKLRDTVLSDLEIGQVREGTVKNITDFGAFIDLGGVDGLLHITDMSWGRINHPSELVSIGDRIKVKVLNFEEGKTRISLGMKQLTPYPWDGVEEKDPVGSIVPGRVVSTTDYGAFVELERGVEGLVHISEMSWTQHIRHPSKIVNVGDQIKVKVLNVDKANEKISLGIKQLEPDPWSTIDEIHPIGSRVKGKVRNLTNFGAFVEIEEGIDGLVHISDMSWTKRIKHPSEVMKKGQIVEVAILGIDKANRRISLGHKQIFDDPWTMLEQRFAVGMITRGTIIRILDRGVVAALENDIEGFVPAFQLGQDIKKPSDAFEVGDELPLKVIEFDKDQRKVVLSVREYFKDKDKSELEEFRQKHQPKPVTLGDTFGAILGDQKTSSASAEASNPAEAEEKAPEPPQSMENAEKREEKAPEPLQFVENAEKREEEATENPGA
jgi:small subunit ribosomal protein S1